MSHRGHNIKNPVANFLVETIIIVYIVLIYVIKTEGSYRLFNSVILAIAISIWVISKYTKFIKKRNESNLDVRAGVILVNGAFFMEFFKYAYSDCGNGLSEFLLFIIGFSLLLILYIYNIYWLIIKKVTLDFTEFQKSWIIVALPIVVIVIASLFINKI